MRYWLDIYRAKFAMTTMLFIHYRVALMFSLLRLFMEPFVYMMVWITVATEQHSINGFAAEDFAAYFLLWIFARHFTTSLDARSVASRIRTGQLSDFLLRPLHPLHLDVPDNFSYKLVMLPPLLVALALLTVIFSPAFHFTLWEMIAFIPALILAAALRFLMFWLLGLIAFWTTESNSFIQVVVTIEIFLTGRIAPLAVMPEWITTIASLSPLRWSMSFPVEILMGLLSPADVVIGLAAQIMWLVIVYLGLQTVWSAGIKRYGAVGA